MSVYSPIVTIFLAVVTILSIEGVVGDTYPVTIFAGGVQGNRDGVGAAARFSDTHGITVDWARNQMFVADSGNKQIRYINLQNARVKTLDLKGDDSFLWNKVPWGVAYDAIRNILYFTDSDNNCIRKVDVTTIHDDLVVSLVAANFAGSIWDRIIGPDTGLLNGPRSQARFRDPHGIVYDQTHDCLYVADSGYDVVRKISNNGNVTTVASGLDNPLSVSVDEAGNKLFIADTNHHKVRVVNLNTGVMTTLAGSGSDFPRRDDIVGTKANIPRPHGVYFDSDSQLLIVTDDVSFGVDGVRIVRVADGATWTMQVSYAPGVTGFQRPYGLAYNPTTGQLYISDDRDRILAGSITLHGLRSPWDPAPSTDPIDNGEGGTETPTSTVGPPPPTTCTPVITPRCNGLRPCACI